MAMVRWSAILLAAALPLAPALGQGTSPLSESERLVFVHEHLANVRRPGALHYVYVADADGKPRLNDRAVLTLSAGAGGRCCDVHGDYLSGPMAVRLPDIPDARSNPVLLYFLEGEVRLLQRTTAGQAAHFRRRIRQALADAGNVTATRIRWEGRDLDARTVRVAPFLDDPFRPRFQEQAATEYAFVLSDAVPGGVYEMSATLPARSAGGAPLARRTLTIAQPN
jgi:hypothetical protein